MLTADRQDLKSASGNIRCWVSGGKGELSDLMLYEHFPRRQHAHGRALVVHPARSLRFARAIHTLLLTPIIVPLVLVAIGVFYAFVRLKMVNTLAGIVFSHSMLAIPLVVLIVNAALKSYDMNQELVARSLGASRPRAFFTITLPQIRFALVTAALLAFLTSFDEVIMAQFIAGGDNSTLTRKMFAALRDQIDPTIAAISTLMVGVTTLLLGLTQLVGRGKGKGP